MLQGDCQVRRRARPLPIVFAWLAFLVLPAWPVPTLAAEKLTVWVQVEDRRREFEYVIKLFKEKNPGVEIELLLVPGSQDEFMEKLGLAIASGAPPDLSWVEGSAVREFAAQGLLLDVTKTLAGIRFTPSDTEEMMFQGKMWAVPYHTTARGLFKRVDFFDQAGLNAKADPASLEELWAWSRKLTQQNSDGTYRRAGFIPWGSNWGPPAWIWTFGGRLVDETGIRPTAAEPRNVAAFDWIRSWALSYGNKTPVQGALAGFQVGTVAMNADSTTVVGRLLAAGVPFKTGRVPHPPGGRNGTWGGGQALAIPVNATHKETASLLLRHFGSADVQIQRFRQFPEALPANWEALLAIGRELPPEYGPLLDQLPEARPRTPLWLDYYVRQLNPALNAVVAGQKTPQQALTDVQRFMEGRFKEVFGK